MRRARCWLGLAVAGAAVFALGRCAVRFPDYPVGDLDAAAGGGGIETGGAGGATGGTVSGGASTGGTAAQAGSGGATGGVGGSAGASASGGSGGSAGAGGAVGRGRLVINEIDYDQPGTDTTEFVEIYNASSENARLDGVELVLVNGSDVPPRDYGRVSLSGSLAGHGFAVVASPLVTPAVGATVFRFAVQNDNIQNGSPDAVGLLDTQSHVLLDALSYEGSVTGAVLTGETGTFDFTEGTPTTAADDSSPLKSLVRIPDGADTNDEMTDWSASLTPTPGAPNQ